MRLSDAGKQFIEHEEGCILSPYLDVTGTPTIGYGQTHYADGRRVTMRDPPLSQAEANAAFVRILAEYESGVTDALMVPVSQTQFDAMVSLAYNIGLPHFNSSTLLRKLNASDYTGAAAQFAVWNKAGGHVNAALVARRAREAAVFMSGIERGPVSMPQQVEGTRPLSESTELRTGTAIAVTGVATAAAPFVPVLQTLASAAPWIFGALVVILAVVGIFFAVRRNSEGR